MDSVCVCVCVCVYVCVCARVLSLNINFIYNKIIICILYGLYLLYTVCYCTRIKRTSTREIAVHILMSLQNNYPGIRSD